MKKLESTWYNMAVVLTAIAVIAGFALGYVNDLTAPIISEIKAQQEKEAEMEVLNGQEGQAIKVTDQKAFGGAMTVMVGLSPNGTILGYKVLESNETPGLGAKAQEWFQKGQKGDIIGKQAGNLSVSKDGGEVDAITASTITSRAFLRCINNASEALSENPTNASTEAVEQEEDAAASDETNTNNI